ncbi:CapA family protein [Bacillus toyonensis]|uniref:CapA family protein n=1 Tax=Bacillus toyonensis TaxID=155322 RepID=UPI000BF190FC|nr:CapA family protein [Bacillus toyonensis]PEK05799.1 capsular biosynthesis protein [Bacillus toyonensis]PGA57675.1 capsular biosynthesis protein [Bacillus toyonensis]PGB91339.1 capsular biosynthesis protein [Bacillus toyonensis]
MLFNKKKCVFITLTSVFLLQACENQENNKTLKHAKASEASNENIARIPNWIGKSPMLQSPGFNKDKKIEAVVNLMATGDNLYHQSVISDGKQKDNSYDYHYIYEDIKEAVQSSDISVVNQETPIAGNSLGLRGYPIFNTPEEVGDALVDTGFNVVTQATNHIMDMEMVGVLNTNNYWGKYPKVTKLGINDSPEEREQIKLLNKKGINFAFLNYTFDLNGKKIPSDKSWSVNIIDKQTIKNDVQKAKQKADIVLVMMHWGKEYTFSPTYEQKDLAQYLSDLGVDVVIGNHPHVIQPVEWKQNKEGHQTLIYYALGNLVSSQEKLITMVGGLSYVQFVKYIDGTAGIRQAALIPIVTHYTDGKKNFKIKFLGNYTEESSKNHGINRFDGPVSLNDFKEIPKSILGDWYKGE